MVDPLSIAGLVLAVISVIQGGHSVFPRLWHALKAAFGGLSSQRDLMRIDQSMLSRQLTMMMQSDASLRRETASNYSYSSNPMLDPFGWDDDGY